MEILLVSTSNSTAVGDLWDPIWIKLVTTGYRFGPVYELTTQTVRYARKRKRKANQSVVTRHKKTVASESTIQKSRSYFRMLYENTNLQGNDLLMGNRGSDLYRISLQETSSPTLICFMAKATPTQAWLWHRRLSHLNFDTINLLSKKDIVNGLPKLKYVKEQLCSSCEMGKAKRSTFKTKTVPSSKG
ncbi:retrovirus-related pol polyprotein from transposon TNT 1-94 [Tanacetum coccineum]|uniref:Retrovirus-related pol polyprotein from transposon TNT 1-94 n=1 Tax=Tanacetum coccineum TaxID=301880 RepID=A0ABQ5I2X9_9ASTR